MTTEFKLPRSTPEEQGLSSKVVEEWLRALDQLRFPNSYMLLRNGFVIAEGWWAPHAPEVRHQLYSLSKSFVSVAIGMAVDEGRLKLDDPVVRFFPDKLSPDMQDPFKRMTVRHLLTMSTGHETCAMGELQKAPDGDYVRAFFSTRLAYEPGSKFVYNSSATYILSAIISALAGENLVEYLNPRLLLPLGVENARWDSCPKGISLGGWGFHLATEEIARFAQMLLNKGNWNGRQLISAEYLEKAVSWQIDNSMNENPDWKLGYGFQFWRSQHNAFRGDGAFGQYAVVIPDLNMVLAATSGMGNMQSVLTLVWDMLLPAAGKKALPENPAALDGLRRFSSSLHIPLAVPGDGVAPMTGSVTFDIEENAVGVKRIGFDFSENVCAVTLETSAGQETIRAGFGKNVFCEETFYYKTPHKMAASAAWKDKSRLEIVCCYFKTPFIVEFHCRFEGPSLTFESSSNLQFGTTDWIPLRGVKTLR